VIFSRETEETSDIVPRWFDVIVLAMIDKTTKRSTKRQ
jgi:hypothetical protein